MLTDATRRGALLAAAALAAACGRSTPPPRSTSERPPAAVATFAGRVDADTGALSIWPEGSPAPLALSVVPVVQDGVPGSGPDGTVELVTVGTREVGSGCGATDAFEGEVTVRAFYPGAVLRNVFVEITSMAPATGREACNALTPAPPGTSNRYGLWSYGTLAPKGDPESAAVATWRFPLPSREPFTFRGRVLADVVEGDVTPPETSAEPPAGSYAGAVTVTLSCADTASGCRATYYTTDGTQPTAASARYAGPFVLAASATVRFFSVDWAGNAGTPAAAAYAVDAVAPRIEAVSPRDRKANVDPSTAVAVTFSEPMDAAATAAAISLAGPSGMVAGEVVADAGGAIFTFTPGAPLAAAARYHLTVDAAGARDVAGNPLEATYVSTFTTPAPVEQVSAATQARYENGALAFDAGSGNGVAAWVATTLTGYRIVSSFYSAASGTWSAPATVHESRQGGPDWSRWHVVLKGAAGSGGYLLAWSDGSDVKAAVLGADGVAGAVATALSAVNGSDTFDVAGGGTAFAVVGALLGDVRAAVWTGTSWAASAVEASPDVSANEPAVAHNGSTFVAVYRETNGGIFATGYAAATKTWTAPVRVSSTSTSADAVPPAVVGNLGATCVAYVEAGVVKAQVATGGTLTFGSAKDLSTGTTGPKALTLAASPAGSLAAGWIATSGTAVNGYGAVRTTTGTWTATSLLEGEAEAVSRVRLAPNPPDGSNAFAAAMAVGATPSAFLNRGSSAGTWTASSAVAIEAAAAPAARPAAGWTGSGVALSWDQDDGAGPQLFVRRLSGGTLAVAAGIAGAPPEGSVRGLRLSGRAGGEAMAVWMQDERNTTAVYAAVRTPAGWGLPARVASDAVEPAVASNGTTWLVVYRAWSPAAQAYEVQAREWSGGVLGDVAVLAAAPALYPSVASDGRGYAAAWLAQGTWLARARIREAGTWGTPLSAGDPQANFPAIAGRANEYLLAYSTAGYTYEVSAQRARFDGATGTWSWTSRARAGAAYGYADAVPAVTASPAGFAVAWLKKGAGATVDSIRASAWNGTVWSTEATLATTTCIGLPAVALASVGGAHRTIHACTPDGIQALSTRQWTGSAWSARETVFQTSYAAAIATDGVAYKIIAASGASPVSLRSVEWGDAQVAPAETLDTTWDNTFWPDVALAFDGDALVAAWTKPSSGVSYRVHARWGP